MENKNNIVNFKTSEKQKLLAFEASRTKLEIKRDRPKYNVFKATKTNSNTYFDF
jgi:hypothetical protein